jgi:hypothetical protein
MAIVSSVQRPRLPSGVGAGREIVNRTKEIGATKQLTSFRDHCNSMLSLGLMTALCADLQRCRRAAVVDETRANSSLCHLEQIPLISSFKIAKLTEGGQRWRLALASKS